MNVSSLGGERGGGKRTTAAQRAAAKRSAARIAKLSIVRRRLDGAAKLVVQSTDKQDPFGERRLLRAAVRRAISAQSTLASMQRRWKRDVTFLHHADKLQLHVTAERARFERLLEKSDARVATAVREAKRRSARRR